MSNRDRKITSISLNIEQQREVMCAMEHMGVDKITVLYRILVKRYLKEHNLDASEPRYKTQAEVIRDAIGRY